MAAARTDHADQLLHTPTWLALWRLGMPQALALCAHVLLNLVDLLLVGRLGAEAVAAAHVASTINFLPMILGNALTVAPSAWIAQRIGANDRAGARAIANQSLTMVGLIALVVGVGTALPADWLVASVGLQPDTRAAAAHYLAVSNLGCLPMFVLMQATVNMRALGETRMPVLVLLGANLLNVGLDVVLLFGWHALGIPPVGVVGAAYATVAARTLAAVIAVAWLCRVWPLRYTWRRRDGRRERMLRALFGSAAPQLVQIGLRAGLIWWLTVLAEKRAGEAAVAALGVTTRVDSLVLFTTLGYTSAATLLSARHLARGDVRAARRVGAIAALHAGVIAIVLVALIWLLREPILELFLPGASADVYEQTMLYLGLAILAHPLGALALAAIATVHGSARMAGAFAVDVGAFAVVVLLVALASGGDLAGIYTAIVIGHLALAGAHMLFLWRGRWVTLVPK